MRYQLSTIALTLGLAASTAYAADCTQGSGNIQASDILELATNVEGNDFAGGPISSPPEVKASHSIQFSLNSVAFCVTNDFLFDNTHVALSDIALGARDVASQCCSTSPCNGGTFTIKGDSGLTTILTVQANGAKCKASLQFDTTGVGAVAADVAAGVEGIFGD